MSEDRVKIPSEVSLALLIASVTFYKDRSMLAPTVLQKHVDWIRGRVRQLRKANGIGSSCEIQARTEWVHMILKASRVDSAQQKDTKNDTTDQVQGEQTENTAVVTPETES